MNEAHEKTRIRQLEDAAAHWEHKYANARQYNRNLEERIAALEAQCAALLAEVMHYTAGTAHPRVVELEAALKEAIGWNWGPSEIDDIPVEVLKQVNKALAPTASETACVHEWGEYSIDNAKSPADPPERYVWIKCIKCGEPQAATSNRKANGP